jgi:hypothetical protein
LQQPGFRIVFSPDEEALVLVFEVVAHHTLHILAFLFEYQFRKVIMALALEHDLRFAIPASADFLRGNLTTKKDEHQKD